MTSKDRTELSLRADAAAHHLLESVRLRDAMRLRLDDAEHTVLHNWDRTGPELRAAALALAEAEETYWHDVGAMLEFKEEEK